MLPRQAKREYGFTLIELVVVFAIITIIMGITIPTYIRFQARKNLEIEADKIVTNLQFAQTKASTGNIGQEETKKVQGFLIDFTSIESNKKYYMRRHLLTASSPYTGIEYEYILASDVTVTAFNVWNGTAWQSTTNRVFYYQLPRSVLVCLNAVPTNGAVQTVCSSEKFRITLTNAQGDTHYVYIEKGGVIYESNS